MYFKVLYVAFLRFPRNLSRNQGHNAKCWVSWSSTLLWEVFSIVSRLCSLSRKIGQRLVLLNLISSLPSPLSSGVSWFIVWNKRLRKRSFQTVARPNTVTDSLIHPNIPNTGIFFADLSSLLVCLSVFDLSAVLGSGVLELELTIVGLLPIKRKRSWRYLMMQFIKKLSVLTQFGRWIEAFGVSHRSHSLSHWILFGRQIKTILV